jgi:hypothetical protein
MFSILSNEKSSTLILVNETSDLIEEGIDIDYI